MLPPEIEESLLEFDRSLNTTIPLRHHWEYIDARSINCKIQAEKDKAFQSFRQVVDKKVGEEKREYAEKFHSEVDKLADAHAKKNEELNSQAHSLLKKRREDLCADFKSAMEAKLLVNPDMDSKSIEELLQTGKESAKSHFEYHTNYGNLGLYDQEQKNGLGILEQELEELVNEILERQLRHLKAIADEKARKLLEELKKSVLEMSKKVEADSHQWNVTKRKLKEKIQKIHKYVVDEGSSVLSEGKNRELYLELLKLEAGECMSAEEFIEWAKGLNIALQVDIEDEMDIQGPIKEEVVEIEDESLDFETPQDMDIDIKLELGGLVLQKSSQKLDQAEKRPNVQNLEERNANCFIEEDILAPKRTKFSETRTAEQLPVAGADEECAFASLHENLREDEHLGDEIHVDPCVGQCDSLTPGRKEKVASTQFRFSSNSSEIFSSSEMDAVELACQEFCKSFRTSVTLNGLSLSQLSNVADLNASTKLGKRKAVNKLMELISNDDLDRIPYLVNELYVKIQKVIDEAAAKNEDHRNQIEFKQHISFTSDYFKTSLEATKFVVKPDTDRKSLENMVKSLKLSTIRNLGNHCGHKSDLDVLQEQKSKLSEKLDFLGQEFLKNLSRHFESGSAKFADIDSGTEVDQDHNPSDVAIPRSCFPVDLAWVLNVPDKDGYVPLLRAIREGHSFGSIKMILDCGANVNVTTIDTCKLNASHETIDSLIRGKLTLPAALAILDLLVEKGFTLINEGGSDGRTPLFYVMRYRGLNEKLLTWFLNNGADFNAVDETGSSVLHKAIFWGQGPETIRKILDFGANPKHVTDWKRNVLHFAANSAHVFALEMFINDMDVNVVDKRNETPLHMLFQSNYKNYEQCVKMLLSEGANFNAQNINGDVPMVRWIKLCHDDCFPALMKVKDCLPITQEIASATLTAIVQEMGRLRKYLPFLFPSLSNLIQNEENQFERFITFLINSKNGKLQLEDEEKWKLYNWRKFKKVILTPDFVKELKTTGRVKWEEELLQVKATILGELDFHSKRSTVCVPIETVLVCILASKNYDGFGTLCQCLKEFCNSKALR